MGPGREVSVLQAPATHCMLGCCLPESMRLQRHACVPLQEQARQVMTLSEVEPRVQEQGKQYEGAKGSLQGAMAAVVSELLSKDKYTHEGEAVLLTDSVCPDQQLISLPELFPSACWLMVQSFLYILSPCPAWQSALQRALLIRGFVVSTLQYPSLSTCRPGASARGGQPGAHVCQQRLPDAEPACR